MKKLLILLFSLLISFNSYGQVELDFSLDTFCDQSPKAQVRNGLFYLPNQQKPYSGKNLCVYLSNGQYFSQGSIKNGLKHGKWTEWHENGQIKMEKNYENGKRDDIWTEWDENGQIINGTSFSYENGKLKEKIIYQDGKIFIGTFYKFHLNDQLKEEINFKENRQIDGMWTAWYENGQIMFMKNFKNGQLDGKLTEWHENGQLSVEGQFKGAMKYGMYREWYENGQMKKEGNYKEGNYNDGIPSLKDGKWTWWYENGLIKIESNYVNGKLSSYQSSP